MLGTITMVINDVGYQNKFILESTATPAVTVLYTCTCTVGGCLPCWSIRIQLCHRIGQYHDFSASSRCRSASVPILFLGVSYCKITGYKKILWSFNANNDANNEANNDLGFVRIKA